MMLYTCKMVCRNKNSHYTFQKKNYRFDLIYTALSQKTEASTLHRIEQSLVNAFVHHPKASQQHL